MLDNEIDRFICDFWKLFFNEIYLKMFDINLNDIPATNQTIWTPWPLWNRIVRETQFMDK